MMISLLVPSRNRPDNVIKLLNNIQETVKDLKNIEFLLAIDHDDRSWEIIKNYNNPIKESFDVYFRSRSDFLNKDYYNWLASMSKGNYLFAIGDDVKFLTKDWSLILEDKIEEYLRDKPDRVVYISVTEKGSKAKHPCFPLITREAFNTLGMYFHPQLMSWGADRCLWEIYSHNSIRRVLHIPEIEIEHISYHDGKAIMDETAKSIKERFFRDPQAHNKVSMYIVPQNIQILQKYIENFNIKNE